MSNAWHSFCLSFSLSLSLFSFYSFPHRRTAHGPGESRRSGRATEYWTREGSSPSSGADTGEAAAAPAPATRPSKTGTADAAPRCSRARWPCSTATRSADASAALSAIIVLLFARRGRGAEEEAEKTKLFGRNNDDTSESSPPGSEGMCGGKVSQPSAGSTLSSSRVPSWRVPRTSSSSLSLARP